MNNFKLLEIVGEGTYSKVYKSYRKSDGCIYALKKVNILELNQKEKLNALNEIRILASLDNDYIINYKEAFFDVENTCLSIVMEYADSGDLLKLIKEYKKKGSTLMKDLSRK